MPADPMSRPVADGITSRERDSRGHEYVVWEPGNGVRYVFLFIATRFLPGDVQGELGSPAGSLVGVWLNPVNHPSRMAAAWFSDSAAHLSPGWIARKLGVSVADATPVARLFAFMVGKTGRDQPGATEKIGP